MLHLSSRLPWNIIEEILHTTTHNTNPIELPFCECGKIFKNKKTLDIVLRHKYLQNQLCLKDNCKCIGEKKFIRGKSKNMYFPPKLKSSNKEKKRYFYDKFIEQIDDFSKTKKINEHITKKEIQIEFEKTKEQYYYQKKFNTIDEMIDDMKKINNFDFYPWRNNSEYQDAFEYIRNLLFDDNMIMLYYIVDMGVNFTKYYQLSFHQYYNDGIYALILIIIEMYITLNCYIMCNQDYSVEFNNFNNIYARDYFYNPIIKKIKNVIYPQTSKSDVDLLCDFTNNDNNMLKFLFNLLVNIRILEIKSNNIMDWFLEYEQATQKLFVS